MAVTDNTALLRARCMMIKTRQNTLKAKERQGIPEPIPPTPAEFPSMKKIEENSVNFRLFASQARDILRNITELRDLVTKKRRDYILCSGGGQISFYGHNNFMSDGDRRKFDADTDTAMRQCGKLIKSLKHQVESDGNLRKEDELKHLLMVIQLLSVYLKDICRIVAQLREIHLKKTQNLQRICRLANLVEIYQTNIAEVKAEDEAKAKHAKELTKELEKTINEEGWESLDEFEENKPLLEENEKFRSATPEFEGIRNRKNKEKKQLTEFEMEIQYSNPPEDPIVELSKDEQNQLMAENEELFTKLSRTHNEIKKIETQMNEIKKLQDIFAEKVLEQEVEIEQINIKTSHTVDNLEAANDFIRQAIQNSAGRRVIMLFCLIVLTFTLLFLDWYNP